MAKQTDENLIDVGRVYTKTEKFIDNNGKPISIAVLVLVLAVAGYFGFTSYIDSQNIEAGENIWKAEYYFEIDSLDKTINGDGQYFGFEYVAENYKGTKNANLANYYLGLIYREKGDDELAIEYFENADVKDEVIGSIALGNIGDIYVDLGDYKKAITFFDKAILTVEIVIQHLFI